MLLEYDGAGFAGSQLQAGQRTVQGVLEAAWQEFSGECSRASFAGRTDSGVHASGQVASVETMVQHDPATVRRALNHFLPQDVAVRAVAEVTALFDPRRDALSRRYRYSIVDGRERSPLRRERSWHVRSRLDGDAMAEAAASLPRDPRDWAAFAGPVPEGYPTVRTLLRCDVRRCGAGTAGERDGAALTVTVEADGFLPRQVRRTVGSLARVGSGKLDRGHFERLIDGAPGSVAPSAPAHGLTLRCVRYAGGTVNWT